MTDQLHAMQQQIVAAVQQQLTQYSEQVSTEVQRLRDEIVAERTARSQLDEQLRALASGLERSHQANTTFQQDLQRALEERLTEFGSATKRRHEEMNQRIDNVVDEANVGLAAAVESATRPILRQVESRQDTVEANVGALDKSIRKFDDQAARMVAHINDMTGSIDGRIEQMTGGIVADVETRVGGLASRIDELSAQSARYHSEVSNFVGQRVEDAELRINDKIAKSESRIAEAVGTRIADIDAYVGRVSVGLDESIGLLNDRIGEVHTRFETIGQQITDMEKSLRNVDVEAIDEMKEKISSAAGEAMLVRIEMERFQESTSEAMDKTTVRLTEVETQLQDQALDTEAAVQLERLEEVERALIMLDPSQFVRVDGASATVGYPTEGDYNDASIAPPSSPLTPPSGHHPSQSATEHRATETQQNPTDSMASLAPPANAQQ